MAEIVIHLSDTFPAGFPQYIVRLCNLINRSVKHEICEIKDCARYRNLIDGVAHEDILNVVHSIRNVSKATTFIKGRAQIFIHGQPDTSFMYRRLWSARIDLSKYELLCSTPDIIALYPARLIPYLPSREGTGIPENSNRGLACQIPQDVFVNYSRWKGELYSFAHHPMPDVLWYPLAWFYTLVRAAMREVARMYSLRYFGYRHQSRFYFQSRSKYLKCLAHSHIVSDSDIADFSNGGNLSITANEALYLGSWVLSMMSDKNAAILEEAVERRLPKALIRMRSLFELRTRIRQLAKTSLPKAPPEAWCFSLNDIERCWAKAAPEWFDE